MSYFKDVGTREPMELLLWTQTRTCWEDQVLLSVVEIDPR